VCLDSLLFCCFHFRLTFESIKELGNASLEGMECISGIGFITHNNVFMETHNRLVKIPFKNVIVWVKAHEMLNVGGSTIHLMLGKTLEKECMGGYDIMCVMHVLDGFEPHETTSFDTLPSSLIDSNVSLRWKQWKDKELKARSQAHSTMGVEGRVGTPGQGLERTTSWSIIHMDLHKPNNKLVSA
jgi:hypothetical protein